MARQQKSYFSNDKLVKDLDQFRFALGAPALSNFFKIELDFATIGAEPKDFFPVDLEAASAGVYEQEKNANDLSQWFTSCGLMDQGDKERYELLANEAMLPGTSMSVAQEVGSRQGIRERFATQRQYTDISISFYLANDYKILKLFQEWMNFMNPLYITQEGIRHTQGYPGGYPNHGERYAFHRQRYPHDYKRNIKITKFERDFDPEKKNLGVDVQIDPTFGHEKRTFGTLREKGKSYHDIGPNAGKEYKPDAITYNFVNAFPISIQDIPLNYSSASMIQVVVDFSYDRYYIVNNQGVAAPDTPTKGASSLVTADNSLETNVDKASN
tara:strand:+ start:3682 stop:4662 length:981 start_codon:yes stop_codon:yes gene_type:complete